MEINEEVLERYHLNTCTADERKQVEEWLFSAESEEVDWSAIKEDKACVKAAIWHDIMPALPQESKVIPLKSNTYFMWKGAIAASIFIAFVATVSFFLLREPAYLSETTMLNNSSDINVKHINAEGYDVSIGPNTLANINNFDGVIDLSGSILISPKEDVSLTFKGTRRTVILKKGQTYIILKGKNDANKIIVVSDKNLLDLPPVIQKQITTQFDI